MSQDLFTGEALAQTGASQGLLFWEDLQGSEFTLTSQPSRHLRPFASSYRSTKNAFSSTLDRFWFVNAQCAGLLKPRRHSPSSPSRTSSRQLIRPISFHRTFDGYVMNGLHYPQRLLDLTRLDAPSPPTPRSSAFANASHSLHPRHRMAGLGQLLDAASAGVSLPAHNAFAGSPSCGRE